MGWKMIAVFAVYWRWKRRTRLILHLLPSQSYALGLTTTGETELDYLHHAIFAQFPRLVNRWPLYSTWGKRGHQRKIETLWGRVHSLHTWQAVLDHQRTER
jgi:hypothetical protein